jgi:hypothetical protein
MPPISKEDRTLLQVMPSNNRKSNRQTGENKNVYFHLPLPQPLSETEIYLKKYFY